MRHGETQFNLQMRVQGWTDSPLTEKGIAQAKIAGDYFRKNGITFDHAYSSTLKRASDTLELVTNMDYEKKENLKEWFAGEMEGMEYWKLEKMPEGDFYKRHGGEHELECRERIVKAVLDIMHKKDHQSVLIVSHGGACSQFEQFWRDFSEISDTNFTNCCILHYVFDEGVFLLKEVIHHDFSSIEK